MRVEIESIEAFDRHVEEHGHLENTVVQGLDLTERTTVLLSVSTSEAVFLGCHLAGEVLDRFCCGDCRIHGAPVIFPRFPGVPFQVYRNRLYSADELLGDYRRGAPETYSGTLDDRIYRRFMASRASPGVMESLAQRVHDHSIDDALDELLAGDGERRRVVAIMGGHSLKRDDPVYADVVRIARDLTRRGLFLASGGGPGAMEATNLGAWLASRDDDALAEALRLLAAAPHYDPKERWLDAAFAVREAFPARAADGDACHSLGIPTWLYGHEPPNVFASHIAKYFANSIREEGLLAIASHGVIYAPGSAGTIQEIFMDACQNHYESFGGASPMVFLGEEYWTVRKPVYPLLQQLAAGHTYASHLSISDDPDDVVTRIASFATSATT